jgi:hypothetical protein
MRQVNKGPTNFSLSRLAKQVVFDYGHQEAEGTSEQATEIITQGVV